MDIFAGLVKRLKADIANLKQGVEMMETGALKTGGQDSPLIRDSTVETLSAYHRAVGDLEATLASLKRKKG